MPKMTAKYREALNTMTHYNNRYDLLLEERIIVTLDNQEALYEKLQKRGFFWNSDHKLWEEFDPADAQEPTPLILIRIWADGEVVEEAADDTIKSLKKTFTLIERSTPYPCRPPKQRESRIYLKFLPRSAKP